jgi:serine protease Do
MKTEKKELKIIITAVLVGLVIGLVVSPSIGKANIFEDISNFFKESFQTATSTPESVEEVPSYESRIDYEDAIIKAVEEASPSVVSIVVTKDIPKMETYDPFYNLPPEFEEFFGRDFEIQRPSEETEEQEIGGGTGFIVSSDGLIATNKHVVLDEEANYSVFTKDGEKYEAEVLARDPLQDIAVLKIKANGLKPAKLGDSDSIKLGQTAIAIGNTLGEFRNTVSVGVISGLYRSITASGAGGFVERIENVIQTDAAINRGNSGGPLLNLRGEVIGMNTAVAENAQSVGFALPINLVKKDVESVKETGVIKTPFLGVRYRIITPEFSEEQNLPVDHGALIRGGDDGPAIVPDSPAQKAGLKAEDIILELNGEEITINKTLGYLIQKYRIGDDISLKVLRNGEEIILQTTLAERSDL